MLTIDHDCPRCKTKRVTFDVLGRSAVKHQYGGDWQINFEFFAKCRSCGFASILVAILDNYSLITSLHTSEYWRNNNLNSDFKVITFVSIKDNATLSAPDHLPEHVAKAFSEGAACLSIGAYNAAGAMFRLSIDLATKHLLPSENIEDGPNRKQRRELASRLEWLFSQNLLPRDLKDLASCVREDGNDGVHDGTLSEADAEDLADFAVAVLSRLHTEPARVALAQQRRAARRAE
jgi:hypothetical protein